MVALDGGGDLLGEGPASQQDRAHEGMVDAELQPLAADPPVWRAAALVEVLLTVQLGQDRVTDVVQQRGDRELVSLAQAGQLGDPLSGGPHGDRVAAESLVALCLASGMLEEVVGL